MGRKSPFLCAVSTTLCLGAVVPVDGKAPSLRGGHAPGEAAEEEFPPQQSRRQLDLDLDDCYTCDAASNPCGPEQVAADAYYFERCGEPTLFVACGAGGVSCYEMQCAPGTAWSKHYETCCHYQNGNILCCGSVGSPHDGCLGDDSGGNRGVDDDYSRNHCRHGVDLWPYKEKVETVFLPQVDVWPPDSGEMRMEQPYWCDDSRNCECGSCCGKWAGYWHMCIPITDSQAMSNVCDDYHPIPNEDLGISLTLTGLGDGGLLEGDHHDD